MSKYFITGGGFGNKGAESMLYTLITDLRNNEPDCEIVVDASHSENLISEDDYSFKIITTDD